MASVGLLARACARGFLVLVGGTLAGCAYLHHEGRDQQGQLATKSASAIKLTDTVAAVAKKHQGLADLELNEAASRAAVIREQDIRALAFSNAPIEESWLPIIESRLKQIIGSGDWPDVEAKQAALRTRLNIAEEMRDAFASAAGRQAPSCDVVQKNATIPEALRDSIAQQDLPMAEGGYRVLRDACQKFLDAKSAYERALAGQGGLLAGALQQLDGDRAEKESTDGVRKAAKAALDKAIADYNAELKRDTAPGEDATFHARLAKAIDKLTKGLEAVEKGQDAIGREVVARARLDHIEQVLSGVAGGNVDTSQWSPETKQAVAVAATLPALADEARKNLAEAGRPRLVPYILAREHQRLVVEEADQVKSVLDRRINAATQIVEAYKSETAALAYVKKHLTAHSAWHKRSLLQLNNEKADDKRVLYELLGIYFDDVPRLQKEERLWEYRRLATFTEESLEHSKYAALMWQNLIDGVAQTLADYHASGLKPADVVELIKAAALLYIGRGVNQK